MEDAIRGHVQSVHISAVRLRTNDAAEWQRVHLVLWLIVLLSVQIKRGRVGREEVWAAAMRESRLVKLVFPVSWVYLAALTTLRRSSRLLALFAGSRIM